MLWFRHMSAASNDEKLVSILSEYGAEGYGVWWIIVETVALQMDKSDRCHASFPLSYWHQKSGIYHHKKFRKILQSLHNLELIFVTSLNNLCTISELSLNNLCTISIPKLLKLRDEYTRKSVQNS